MGTAEPIDTGMMIDPLGRKIYVRSRSRTTSLAWLHVPYVQPEAIKL